MYCVNCGVKLADTENTCPLCGTPAFHPELLRPAREPLYPPNRHPAPQVSSRGSQIIATALFLIPMLVCLQCDLLINRRVSWSGYVAGGLATAYVALVLPHWFRKPNPVVFCPLSFLAAGVYLLYINYAVKGSWFLSFGLPVTGGLGLLCTALAALLRYLRRGRLYIFGGALICLGAFMPLVELLLCATFASIRFQGWSFYPLTVLTVLGGMLIFLAVNRRAREKMEKKFFI